VSFKLLRHRATSGNAAASGPSAADICWTWWRKRSPKRRATIAQCPREYKSQGGQWTTFLSLKARGGLQRRTMQAYSLKRKRCDSAIQRKRHKAAAVLVVVLVVVLLFMSATVLVVVVIVHSRVVLVASVLVTVLVMVMVLAQVLLLLLVVVVLPQLLLRKKQRLKRLQKT
jgi:hypothetical protein